MCALVCLFPSCRKALNRLSGCSEERHIFVAPAYRQFGRGRELIRGKPRSGPVGRDGGRFRKPEPTGRMLFRDKVPPEYF